MQIVPACHQHIIFIGWHTSKWCLTITLQENKQENGLIHMNILGRKTLLREKTAESAKFYDSY